MKAFLLLIVLVLAACENCDGLHGGNSADDCNKLTKLPGADYCCWFHAKENGQEFNMCLPIDKTTYDQIGDKVDEMKKQYKDASDIKLDCSSKYLSVALISLLLVLF